MAGSDCKCARKYGSPSASLRIKYGGGAVVYLSNTRTRAVKTFIAGQDGVYRFPALSPSIDYEVYAQFEGHKSDTKTMSQFDTRPTVNINLRIDTK
jgi:hypothetical protein